MWVWTLNWDEIRDDLLIGSCPRTALDLARIRHKNGVTAIFSLQHDQCLASLDIDYELQRRSGQRLGLVMTRIPMLDFNPQSQRRQLPAAVHRLAQLLAGRHRVYVHCTAGMGRSALVVLGYLTFFEGCTPEAALRLLKAKRPGVVPNLDAWRACRADLLNPRHAEVECRAWLAWRGRCARQETGSAEDDWRQAEQVVLREALSVTGHASY